MDARQETNCECGDHDQPSASEGWQPMSTAPRDQSLIVIRLIDDRRQRKFREHVVRWDPSGVRPCWRSQIVQSHPIWERECMDWHPMDDDAYALLRTRREQKKAREKAARSRKAANGRTH
jgi:hypothetical protein